MAEIIQLALVVKTLSGLMIFLWLYQYVSFLILGLTSAPDEQKGILIVQEHDVCCAFNYIFGY